ncbi:hypothetical protein GCM10022232_12320 [Streptomyces plumbiresistens]|uniref:Uncharacterized protein n=1 Tax=Streptomyces plumbiresistens TaxID=511811 RepID=A0ABP7QFE5_9ACTN
MAPEAPVVLSESVTLFVRVAAVRPVSPAVGFPTVVFPAVVFPAVVFPAVVLPVGSVWRGASSLEGPSPGDAACA